MSVGAVLGLLAALAGVGWSLLSREPDSLTLLPIPDQSITQGDELRVPIAVRQEGLSPGP